MRRNFAACASNWAKREWQNIAEKGNPIIQVETIHQPVEGNDEHAHSSIENRRSWSLGELERLPLAELDALFASAGRTGLRSAGAMPDGDSRGVAMLGNWRPLRAFGSIIRPALWQGKVFARVDEDHGALTNKILLFGMKGFKARVCREPSRVDGRECIVLDYSKTFVLARFIRDEIREVSPGVYLGLVYWGRSSRRLLHFALDTR